MINHLVTLRIDHKLSKAKKHNTRTATYYSYVLGKSAP